MKKRKKKCILREMFKRTKPIFTSARDSETLQIAKVKFDNNKVHKKLEETNCLTSEKNVTQVNMIFTYRTTSCDTYQNRSQDQKRKFTSYQRKRSVVILISFSRNLLCNMLMVGWSEACQNVLEKSQRIGS